MDFPRRKSPRIPGFDYSSANYYFITICTHEKRCIFGKPGQLSKYGKYAEEYLLKMAELHPNIRIDKYVVMPNHIHAIIDVSAENSGKNNIAFIIGQYKMAVTKKIRSEKPKMDVWQRSFHDHIIRDQKGYEKIWTYIDYNPTKWEEDCFYISDSKEVSQREGH